MQIRPASSHLKAATLTLLCLCALPAAAQQTAAPDAAPEVVTETPAPEAPVLPADTSPAAPDTAPAPSAPAASDAPAAPDTTPAPDDPAAAQPAPASAPETTPAAPLDRATRFLVDGGPAIWAITALAVLTLALILWKTWRFFLAGAWSRGAAFRAVEAWAAGDAPAALALLEGRKGTRSRLTRAAIEARLALDEPAAREEVTRAARRRLGELSTGLRALELIATIAPLLGLLGTVLGMIEAFQTLQTAGSRADPSLLAGGIWEALLTTAAGMAVAIPASAALTWFESVRDSIRADMEDIAARIFIADTPPPRAAPAMARAAE
ncbi:MotA/TolQ/ExbB proton channel family protein [Vannielia litorea]|uniref:Outer membrane transport energization protein ExbB n=1 Tax=Vannielia litorea TaxID=1217970 RepID=A0A1N6EBT8_9RHOB|nr:MotA/TolQ/ExbB proton channel family protein [Vannielia litorea]SIN80498.1 outer membrane transport energization protein ExbB [Vannielia litorea]